MLSSSVSTTVVSICCEMLNPEPDATSTGVAGGVAIAKIGCIWSWTANMLLVVVPTLPALYMLTGLLLLLKP